MEWPVIRRIGFFFPGDPLVLLHSFLRMKEKVVDERAGTNTTTLTPIRHSSQVVAVVILDVSGVNRIKPGNSFDTLVHQIGNGDTERINVGMTAMKRIRRDRIKTPYAWADEVFHFRCLETCCADLPGTFPGSNLVIALFRDGVR